MNILKKINKKSWNRHWDIEKRTLSTRTIPPVRSFGTLPSNFSHDKLGVLLVTPITGSPSIASPSKSATSSRVIVISPTGK